MSSPVLDSRFNWFWIAVAGQKAPQVLVDDVRASADEFRALGAGVGDSGPQVEALRAQVSRLLPPDVAEGFSRVSRMFSDSLPDLGVGAAQLADGLDRLALDVEKTVYSMIIEVSAFAASAVLALLTPFTAWLVPGIVTAARALVSALVARLVQAATAVAARLVPGLSRIVEAVEKLKWLARILGAAAHEGLQEVGQEALAQGIQMAQGNRALDDVDGTSLVAAGLMGAAAGAQVRGVSDAVARSRPKVADGFLFHGVNSAAAEAVVGTSAAAITGQSLDDAWTGPVSGFTTGAAGRLFQSGGNRLGQALPQAPEVRGGFDTAGAAGLGAFADLTGLSRTDAGSGSENVRENLQEKQSQPGAASSDPDAPGSSAAHAPAGRVSGEVLSVAPVSAPSAPVLTNRVPARSAAAEVSAALAGLDPAPDSGGLRDQSRTPERGVRRSEPEFRWPPTMSAPDRARLETAAAAAHAHLDALPPEQRDALHDRARRIVTASSAAPLPQISGDGRPVQPTPYGRRIDDITAVVATVLPEGPAPTAAAEHLARDLARRFDNPWPTSGAVLGGATAAVDARPPVDPSEPGPSTRSGSEGSPASAPLRPHLTDEQNALRQVVPLPQLGQAAGGVLAPRSADETAAWSAAYVAAAQHTAGSARPFLVFGAVEQNGVRLADGPLDAKTFANVVVRSGLDPRGTGPVVLVLDGPRSPELTADIERNLAEVAPGREVRWSTPEELQRSAQEPPSPVAEHEEFADEARDAVPDLPRFGEFDPDDVAPHLSRGLGMVTPTGVADPAIVSDTVDSLLAPRGLAVVPEHRQRLAEAVQRNLADFVGEGRTVSVPVRPVGGTSREDRGWDVNVRVTFEKLRPVLPPAGHGGDTPGTGLRSVTRWSETSGSSVRRIRGQTFPLQLTVVPTGFGISVDASLQRQRVTTASARTGSARGQEIRIGGPGDRFLARTRFEIEVAPAARGGRGVDGAVAPELRRTVRSDVELTVPKLLQKKFPGTAHHRQDLDRPTVPLERAAAARLAGARSLHVGAVLDTHGLRRRRTDLLPDTLTRPGGHFHEHLDDVSSPLTLGPVLLEALLGGQPLPPVAGAKDSWTSLWTRARIESVRPTHVIAPRQRTETVNEVTETLSTGRQSGRSLGVSPTVGVAAGPADLVAVRAGPQIGTSETSENSRETATTTSRGRDLQGERVVYETRVVLEEWYYDGRSGRWSPTLQGHPLDVVLDVQREEARALGLPDGGPVRAADPVAADEPGRELPAWMSGGTTGRLAEVTLPVDTAERVERQVRDVLTDIGRGHLLPNVAEPGTGRAPKVSDSDAQRLFGNHARLAQAVSSRSLASLTPRKVVLRDPHVLHRGPDGSGVLFKDVVTIDIVPRRGTARWTGQTTGDVLRTMVGNGTRWATSRSRAWTADAVVDARFRIPFLPGLSAGAFLTGRAGAGRGRQVGGGQRQTTRAGQYGNGTTDLFDVPVEVEVRVRVDRVPHARPRWWGRHAVAAYIRGAPMPPSGRVLHELGGEVEVPGPLVGSPRTLELQGVLSVARSLTRPAGLPASTDDPAPSRSRTVLREPGRSREQLLSTASSSGPRADADSVLGVAEAEELLGTVRNLALKVVGPDALRRLDQQLHTRFGAEAVQGRFTTDGWSTVLDGLHVTVRPTLGNSRLVDVLATPTVVEAQEMAGAEAVVGRSRTRSASLSYGAFLRSRFLPFTQWTAGHTLTGLRTDGGDLRTVVESWRGKESAGTEPRFVVQHDVRWDVVVERGRRQRLARALFGRPASPASASYVVGSGLVTLLSEDAARGHDLLDGLDTLARTNDERLAELGVPGEVPAPSPAPSSGPPAPWALQAPDSLRGGSVNSLGAGRASAVPDARVLLGDLEAAMAERGRSVLPPGPADRRDNRQAALKFLASPSVRSHLAGLVDGGVPVPIGVHQDRNRLGELRLEFSLGRPEFVRTEAGDGAKLSIETTSTSQRSSSRQNLRADRLNGGGLAGSLDDSHGWQYAPGGWGGLNLTAGITGTRTSEGSTTLENRTRLEVRGPRAVFSVPVATATLSFTHPDGQVDSVTRTDLDPLELEFDAEPLRVVPPADAPVPPARAEAVGPDTREVVARSDVARELADLRRRRTVLPALVAVDDVQRSATVRDALAATRLPVSSGRELRTALDDETSGERSGQRVQQYVSRALATNDAVKGWMLRANRAPVELGDVTAEVALTGGRVTAATSRSTTMVLQTPAMAQAPGWQVPHTRSGQSRAVERGSNVVLAPLSANTTSSGWTAPTGPLSATATGRSTATTTTAGAASRQLHQLAVPGVVVTFDAEILLDGGHPAGAVRVRMPHAVSVRMTEQEAARLDEDWRVPAAARAAEKAAERFAAASGRAQSRRREAYVAAMAVEVATGAPADAERTARVALRTAAREQRLAERARDEAEHTWARAKYEADAALDREHPRPQVPAPTRPAPAPPTPTTTAPAVHDAPAQVAAAVSDLLATPATAELLGHSGFTARTPAPARSVPDALAATGTVAALAAPLDGAVAPSAVADGPAALRAQVDAAVDRIRADLRSGRRPRPHRAEVTRHHGPGRALEDSVRVDLLPLDDSRGQITGYRVQVKSYSGLRGHVVDATTRRLRRLVGGDRYAAGALSRVDARFVALDRPQDATGSPLEPSRSAEQVRRAVQDQLDVRGYAPLLAGATAELSTGGRPVERTPFDGRGLAGAVEALAVRASDLAPGESGTLTVGSGSVLARHDLTVRVERPAGAGVGDGALAVAVGTSSRLRNRLGAARELDRWSGGALSGAAGVAAGAPRETRTAVPSPPGPAAGSPRGGHRRTDVLRLPGGKGLLVPAAHQTREQVTAIGNGLPRHDGVDLLVFHPDGRNRVQARGGVMSVRSFADVVRAHWNARSAPSPDVVVLVAGKTALVGTGTSALDEQFHEQLGRPVISSDAEVWSDLAGRVFTGVVQVPGVGRRVPGRPGAGGAQFFLLDRGRRIPLGTAKLAEALSRVEGRVPVGASGRS